MFATGMFRTFFQHDPTNTSTWDLFSPLNDAKLLENAYFNCFLGHEPPFNDVPNVKTYVACIQNLSRSLPTAGKDVLCL